MTPMNVALVGHLDLGIVNAEWDGPYLVLDDGTRYGPSAIFCVRPVPPPPPLPGPAVNMWVRLVHGGMTRIVDIQDRRIIFGIGRWMELGEWHRDEVTAASMSHADVAVDEQIPF